MRIETLNLRDYLPDFLTDFFKERQEFREEVEASWLVNPFLDYIQNNYDSSEISDVMWSDPRHYLLWKINSFSIFSILWEVDTETSSSLYELRTMIDELSWFWSKDQGLESLIKQYVRERKQWKTDGVQAWMKARGMLSSFAHQETTSDSREVGKDLETEVRLEEAQWPNAMLVKKLLQENQDVLQQQWELVHVDNIVYRGEVILQAKSMQFGTPDIHKDVLHDLLWFAYEFHRLTGKALSMSSMYRDFSGQAELYNLYKKGKWNLAAKPGESGHNYWRSIDFDLDSVYSSKIWWKQWFKALAKKYNFHATVASEDWHFDHQSLIDMKKRTSQDDRISIAQDLENWYRQAA